MKLVYICSPLRGDIENNIKKANRYCEFAVSCGVIPFAPHVAWSGFFDDTIPEKREAALKLGLEMMKRCDELWVCGDEISQGMQGEIESAEQLGITTQYILDDNIVLPSISRHNNEPLTESDCVENSNNANYQNCILVIKPSSLQPEYRNAKSSLWFATHGPGCRIKSFSDTVHAICVADGDKGIFRRSDFHGIVKSETLDNWRKNTFIENYDERVHEALKQQDRGIEL